MMMMMILVTSRWKVNFQGLKARRSTTLLCMDIISFFSFFCLQTAKIAVAIRKSADCKPF